MTTTNYSIPELASAQAQKHITVNEGFNIIDSAMNLVAIRIDFTAPPGSPNEGDIYVPAATATGAWTGQENNVALYQNATWNFFTPKVGWRLYDQNQSDLLVYNGSAWVGFGTSLTSFSLVGINGATADATNVLSVAGPGVLFNQTTGDFNLTINKGADADSGTITFQDAFSTRAIIGTDGSNDFVIKVSDDGTGFTDAISINDANGIVTLGNDLRNANGTNTSPSVTFSSDTNTGMYRIAADRLGFAAGGVASFEVSSTQAIANLGDFLVTSTGSSRLKVNKNAVGDDAVLELQTAFTTQASFGLSANNDMTVKAGTGSTTAMVIDNSTAAVELTQHPKFAAYLNFGQNTTADAWFKVPFNNETHDDQSVFDTTDNDFTAPHDGYYLFGATVTHEDDGTDPSYSGIGFGIDNTDPTDQHVWYYTAGHVGGETSFSITCLIKLTANQTVDVRVYSGTNSGRIEANSNNFWGCQIA